MNISRAKRSNNYLDMAPLIDVVFLLLIFYMLTSTFVKDEGLSFELPSSSTAEELTPNILRITLKPSGDISVNESVLSLVELTSLLRDQKPKEGVVILTSSETAVQKLVSTMDAIRQSGVTAVSVETNRTTT